MDSYSVFVQEVTLKNDLVYNGEILLSYQIQYPLFHGAVCRGCIAKINKYYETQAHTYRQYCEAVLFCLAVRQYRDDMQNGYPVRKFDVMQTFEATYLQSCLVSVYFDRYEYTGGAHGTTLRQSQNWQLQCCGLLSLSRIVRCPPDCKTHLLSAITAQIAAEPDVYFENAAELAAQTFNPNQFYCTPDGLVLYYQQYDIAPYSSGIREFLIPYGDCVLPPAELCRKV